MFKMFENLVDPFAEFEEKTPPSTYWAYMRSQIAPFRRWVPWMLVAGFVVAVMESGLIFYSGRIIDLMNDTGAAGFWASHGLEVCAVAIFILIARPSLICFQRLFLEQTLVSNMQDQVRWRAHKHMLGQSIGFFQNDFAGRLSNRVMQLGPAVEDSFYMAFEAIWYFLVYIVGVTLILSQIDWRLAVPMVIWFVIYASYTFWVAMRVSKASEKWSAARSMVTGRVVDAYANVESVKLFADNSREEAYAKHSMRRHRVRLQRFLRLMTELSFVSNVINGVLIVGVTGPAIILWRYGVVSVGDTAAAMALTLRLNGMSGWIMWVTIRLFEHSGVVREGLESVAVPHGVKDVPNAGRLTVGAGQIRFDKVEHHYARRPVGLAALTCLWHLVSVLV